MFALKKTDLEGGLPTGFINVSVQKGRWVFSSLELVRIMAKVCCPPIVKSQQKKMNARMKDALDETLILSHKQVISLMKSVHYSSVMFRIIQDIVAQVVHDIGALYKASEAVRFLRFSMDNARHTHVRLHLLICFGHLPTWPFVGDFCQIILLMYHYLWLVRNYGVLDSSVCLHYLIECDL